jgi:hypothetical protein
VLDFETVRQRIGALLDHAGCIEKAISFSIDVILPKKSLFQQARATKNGVFRAMHFPVLNWMMILWALLEFWP